MMQQWILVPDNLRIEEKSFLDNKSNALKRSFLAKKWQNVNSRAGEYFIFIRSEVRREIFDAQNIRKKI